MKRTHDAQLQERCTMKMYPSKKVAFAAEKAFVRPAWAQLRFDEEHAEAERHAAQAERERRAAEAAEEKRLGRDEVLRREIEDARWYYRGGSGVGEPAPADIIEARVRQSVLRWALKRTFTIAEVDAALAAPPPPRRVVRTRFSRRQLDSRFPGYGEDMQHQAAALLYGSGPPPRACKGAGKSETGGLSGVALVALNALRAAVAAHGETTPGTAQKAAAIEHWRAQFRKVYGIDDAGNERDPGTVKKAFRRAREQLARAGVVGDMAGGQIFFSSQAQGKGHEGTGTQDMAP